MNSPDLLEPPTAPKNSAPTPMATKPTPAPAGSVAPAASAAAAEHEPETVIDTSKMSQAQREALELTEAARTVTNYRSFAGDLFMGRFALDHVYPFPLQAPLDVEAGRPFLAELN